MPSGECIRFVESNQRGEEIERLKEDMLKAIISQWVRALSSAIGWPIFRSMENGSVAMSRIPDYSIALFDGFNPPVIRRIEQRDDRILVEATDNVMVTKVQITILDEQGQVLQQGEAIRTEGDCWEFPTHAKGKVVIAEAWDLAGNKGQLVG